MCGDKVRTDNVGSDRSGVEKNLGFLSIQMYRSFERAVRFDVCWSGSLGCGIGFNLNNMNVDFIH